MKGKWLILCEFAEILKCLYACLLPCGGLGKQLFTARLTPLPGGEPFLHPSDETFLCLPHNGVLRTPRLPERLPAATTTSQPVTAVQDGPRGHCCSDPRLCLKRRVLPSVLFQEWPDAVGRIIHVTCTQNGRIGVALEFCAPFFNKRKFERILKTHLGHPRTEKSGGQSTRRSRRRALHVQGEGVWSGKGPGQHRGPVWGDREAQVSRAQSLRQMDLPSGCTGSGARSCRLFAGAHLCSTFSFPCETSMRTNPETRFLLT